MLRWGIELPLKTKKYLSTIKQLVLFEFIPADEIISYFKSKLDIKITNDDETKVGEYNIS